MMTAKLSVEPRVCASDGQAPVGGNPSPAVVAVGDHTHPAQFHPPTLLQVDSFTH